MKKLNRISRLLTAFIIVMLLNIILLLLPIIFESKKPPESVEGHNYPPDTETTSSEISSSFTLPFALAPIFPTKSDDNINFDQSTDITSLGGEDTEEQLKTVTLCLMGDLMCLAGQQYTAERRDETHDYTGSFHLVREFFSSCDFVVGNLETTLSESNPYSTKEREVN